MNYGHLFVASLTFIELAASYCYFQTGDRARCVMWICYAIANVATLFIGETK
jgi:hypothetical protein